MDRAALEITAILIPAYKPDDKLVALVNELLLNPEYRVVVVNDGSGADFDAVFAMLPEAVVTLTHDVNRGKGEALKTGFAYINDNIPAAFTVTADADGQHTPADIAKTLDAAKANPGALTLGSRRFVGNVPFKSRAGNAVTRLTFKLVTGLYIRDTQTGLRAIPRGLLPEFAKTEGSRYEYEINMLLYCASAKVPVVESDIETVYIDGNKSSHFNAFRDSFRIYRCLLSFCAASLASFLIDFILLFIFKAILFKIELTDPATELFIAAAAARVVSSAFNFTVNRTMVFKSHSNVAVAVVKYAALALIILGANYGLLYLLNIMAGMPLFWAKLITEAGLFAVSYAVQKTLIFNKKS